VTQTGVPLNATMAPQRCMIAIYRLVTGQLADTPTRGLPTRELADWTSRGLDNSRFRDATRRTKTKQAMSPVASARCPVRESYSPRVGNPRVGVSASCRVTYRFITNILSRYRQCANFVPFHNRKPQTNPVSCKNLKQTRI